MGPHHRASYATNESHSCKVCDAKVPHAQLGRVGVLCMSALPGGRFEARSRTDGLESERSKTQDASIEEEEPRDGGQRQALLIVNGREGAQVFCLPHVVG